MRSLEQMRAAVVADSRRRTYAMFGRTHAAFGQRRMWLEPKTAELLANTGAEDSVCPLPRKRGRERTELAGTSITPVRRDRSWRLRSVAARGGWRRRQRRRAAARPGGRDKTAPARARARECGRARHNRDRPGRCGGKNATRRRAHPAPAPP